MSVFAVILAVVTIATCFLLMYFPNIHNDSVLLAENMKARRDKGKSVSTEMIRSEQNELKLAKKGQVRITIPRGVDENSVVVNASEIDKLYEVAIDGVSESYFDGAPVVGLVDHIDDLKYYYEDGKAYVDVSTDSIYECQVSKEGGYLYLNFVDPHELYDSVVVIDAGHGGVGPGTVKGGVSEKDIDLAIVLKLKELLDQNDKIKAYYTRLDDSDVQLWDRVNLANDVKADLFLSVHNNSINGSRMSSTSGTQVLYYTGDPTGKSKEFAEICLNNLCNTLGSTNRGLVNGDDILIIHNSKVPVALAEIGFISNPKELMLLINDEYQRKTAEALYNSILEMLHK